MRAAKPLGEAKGAFSLDDEIVSEHFTRNIQFFGRASQEKIMQSFVIVVGLGVGSHLLYLPTSAGSNLTAEPHVSDSISLARLPDWVSALYHSALWASRDSHVHARYETEANMHCRAWAAMQRTCC